MWIILLDCSGSMANPFSSTPPDRPAGKERRTNAQTKWLGAKEALLEEVDRLNPSDEICIIKFSNTASVVFEGSASESSQIRSVLDLIEPDGGTNVAAALDTALEHMARRRADATTTVEVITDGLTDIDKAEAAALRASERAGRIEVLLIDPTDEGRAVARVIAIRGRVDPVWSAAELGSETRSAAERHVAERERVSAALAKVDEARDATVASVPAPERLSLTVAYPGEPIAEVWYSLTLYLHVKALREEVRRRMDASARRLSGPLEESTTHLSLLRGTWLTITPQCDGVTFNPTLQEVAWCEDVQEICFRFSASAGLSGQLLSGSLEVCADDGLPIARLGLSFRVREEGSLESNVELTSAEAEMFQSLFASYSHADIEVVEHCAVAYRGLGIEVFIDRDALLSGQSWHPALRSLIDRSDLFQLYWSENARSSVEVGKEWRHALSLLSTKGDRFVRGLYWQEPMPDPPEPLRHTHFSFLDRTPLRSDGPDQGEASPIGTADGKAQARREPSPTDEILRAQELEAVVIPLAAGETRRSLQRRRRQVAQAISFLESVTGLQNNSVPTILVDELLVTEVRRRTNVVDKAPEREVDPTHREELEVWRDLLRAQLLDFHQRHVPPRGPSDDLDGTRHTSPSPPDGVPFAVYDALQQCAEFCLEKWLHEYLDHPWSRNGKDLSDTTVPDHIQTESLASRVIAVLDKTLGAAGRAGLLTNRRRRSVNFRRNTSNDPAGLDNAQAWESLRSESIFSVLRQSEVRAEPSDYEIDAPCSDLVATLSVIREELAGELPRHESSVYTAAEGPSIAAARCMALAICAEELVGRLYYELPDDDRIWPYPNAHISDWVARTVYPHWRRIRDALQPLGVVTMKPDLDFRSFLECYFDLMLRVLKPQSPKSLELDWKSRYSIERSTWEAVANALPSVDVDAREAGSAMKGSEKMLLRGPFASFLVLLQEGAHRLVALLDRVPPVGAPTSNLVEEALSVATKGIFVPAGSRDADASLVAWTSQRGMPAQASLPDSPKVLFRTGGSTQTKSQTERILEQCTLVHEHFHAIVETGLDERSQAALGPRRALDDWVEATPLNEALAAWMELYFVRRYATSLGTPVEIQDVESRIWAYIRHGDYPEWPYRGAESVEALFLREGAAAIRKLVLRLRHAPVEARKEFESVQL